MSDRPTTDTEENDMTTTERDLLYEAWAVIANAGGGNWQDNESPEWVEAAERWRDRWHGTLESKPSDG